MLKLSLRTFLIAATFVFGGQLAFSQMTDKAVMEYAQKAKAMGKSNETIAQELFAKGVTREQAERIRRSLTEGSDKGASGSGINSVDQTRRPAGNTDTRRQGNNRMDRQDDVRTSRQDMNQNRRPAGDYPPQGMYNDYPYYDYENMDSLYIYEDKKSKIFGHDVFTNKNLSFEPNQNMATPADYRLGPGDTVFINIFGESEDNITATISPEGSIILSQIGPVYLNGLTVDEANNRLRRIFAQRYAGFDNNQSDVNLALGDVRSIMVNVMGEVDVPGTYRMSPFSSVFSALYNAGGISDIGSIRNVHVMRGGKEVVSVDLYDYIFNGKTSDNIRLQEGDVIVVPAADRVVVVDGEVKRPMLYEMLPEESVADLLRYAGGFTGAAATGNLVVSRFNGKDKDMMNVAVGDFDTFTLRDGDEVTIGITNDRVQNGVKISGSVLRPGDYALDSHVSTVSELIEVADGLLENAFTTRAVLYRFDENRQREIVTVDVEGILNGTAPDITLRRDDELVIYDRDDIFDFGTLSIRGLVNFPGDYVYAADATIDDLILMAGGLRQGASLARVDVARRVIDPYSLRPTSEIAKIYQFAISEGYVMNPDSSFHLQPFDVVTVRQSPGYEPQRSVTVTGEVLFGGQYTLQKRNERLTDILRRTGGLTESAYSKGASLRRRLSADERLAREEMQRLAKSKQNSSDSISTEMLNLDEVFPVGIDLEKAIANPGSSYDIVMRDGDVLNIPELVSTVSVSGDVLFPNTVTYVPGKKFKYYVEQAGGFGEKARKGECYVVYLNGEVAKAKSNTPIEPGSRIIVPSKGETKGTDWAQIMSISSVIASLATMTATVVSIIRK